MPRKCLVINASVARAAWGEIDPTAPETIRCHAHSIAKACRKFLEEVRRICYRAVMTPEIAEEWDKHQNNFAMRWRTDMGRHGKLCRPKDTRRDDLREKIAGSTKNKGKAQAMLKDVHLLEAALATDNIVISLDDMARKFYTEISPKVKEIKGIVWRNPTDKDIVPWLKSGASPDKKYWLD